MEKGVEDVNIKTTDKPKLIKQSKSLSLEVKDKFIHLLSKFSDVFVWDYADLNEYDKKIIQHTIPIKPDQKPFRQKLISINPRLLPSIKKEVNKIFKENIIVPIIFFDWMSNLVSMRKKTREIRL